MVSKIKKALTIGLTGGPGVGKSEVAKILTENGAQVISADAIGHDLLDNNLNLRRKLINFFGEDIVDRQNKPDRRKIGAIVFNNGAKLAVLNSIIHPLLLKKLKQEMTAKTKTKRRLIVVDAALIFEWGIANWFDLILVVNAKRDIRLKRICRAGLGIKQARQRVASQIPQRDKIALADYIIENNSSRSALRKKVEQFIIKIKAL
jgi:dephospho-CoA kinase